jgi:hypothetical protein
MAGISKRRAAGFTLPLTMVLGFSLMTLASAVVGMVVVSDQRAKTDARALVVRTSLESAIEAGLFGLEHDGEPEVGEWTASRSLNGLNVSLTFADARYKPDLDKDTHADVGAAIADPSLARRIAAAYVSGKPDEPVSFSRFTQFVQAVGADAAEEDCLRRRLTLGRPGAQRDPTPVDIGFIPTRDPLAAGEVIDVRAAVTDPNGGREVLWRRVRYTGKPERAWLTHDWRQLRLGRADIPCPFVPPAASFGDFRLSH